MRSAFRSPISIRFFTASRRKSLKNIFWTRSKIQEIWRWSILTVQGIISPSSSSRSIGIWKYFWMGILSKLCTLKTVWSATRGRSKVSAWSNALKSKNDFPPRNIYLFFRKCRKYFHNQCAEKESSKYFKRQEGNKFQYFCEKHKPKSNLLSIFD